MKTRVCFRYPVMCYLVCVTCTTIIVAATAVNTVTIFDNMDTRDNLKLLRRNVMSGEKMRRPSLEIQTEVPYWNTPLGSRTGSFFEQSKESNPDGTVIFSSDECARYCIGKGSNTDDDNFQYINIFWSSNGIDTADNPVPKGHLQLTMPEVRSTDEQNSNNVPRKCQIYLDLDCETAEAGTRTNYTEKELYANIQINKQNGDDFERVNTLGIQTHITITEKFNVSERMEIKFSVDRRINRIIINVDGNISSAALRIPTNATTPWLGTMISWTRKGDTEGMKIDTRNAPPGEWWMKFMGEKNSKYHFAVVGFVEEAEDETRDKLFFPAPRLNDFDGASDTTYRSAIVTKDDIKLSKDKTIDDFKKASESKAVAAEQQNSNATNNFDLGSDKKITRQHESFAQELNNRTSAENSNENDSSVSTSTENILANYVEYAAFMGGGNVTTSNYPSDDKQSSGGMISTEDKQEIHARSSVEQIESIDIKTPVMNNARTSMNMIEALDNRELSEELVNYRNENSIDEKRMLIEVNRNSNLLVTPGTIHRVVFDVMNNCVLPVRYGFRVRSTPFRVYNLQPTYAWIYPGQMSNVAVDLIIPDNAAPDTANTVTLSIQGTEIKDKSVYLYVQGSLSKLTDDVKPKMEYSFNNNCAGKLEKGRCYKSRWSMDITIQDYDSGLQRVISSPNEIYPQSEFISGTRSPIKFYYSATCCDVTVKITARDLLDNYNTQTIDVTVWNNLSEAEIASITVGVLLALFIIILIIISIIYCIRRRKSLNLPYTQRYGSRPPAQAERTSF
ncbi:uncharacterized protein LOC128890574 [Hylaeus anthracinus]|uniref:uncharacterized protein LOC128890574 n=1 Tax=Hylaeus anthracinus TaxID=313031 RepID=UPI0023BA2E2F|nr:uncharacterized protein LOC128890574 [Hylaeus anthracinus]